MKIAKNDQKYRRYDLVASDLGGLIGGVVYVLTTKAIAAIDDIGTCGLDELPPLVRNALNPAGKFGVSAWDVVILPRDAAWLVRAQLQQLAGQGWR